MIKGKKNKVLAKPSSLGEKKTVPDERAATISPLGSAINLRNPKCGWSPRVGRSVWVKSLRALRPLRRSGKKTKGRENGEFQDSAAINERGDEDCYRKGHGPAASTRRARTLNNSTHSGKRCSMSLRQLGSHAKIISGRTARSQRKGVKGLQSYPLRRPEDTKP